MHLARGNVVVFKGRMVQYQDVMLIYAARAACAQQGA